MSRRSATRHSTATGVRLGPGRQRYFSGGIQQNAPGYLPELLARGRAPRGKLRPWEAEEWGSGSHRPGHADP